MDIKNRNFSVLGMGKSGISAARKIKQLGGKVFLSEFKSKDQVENSEFLEKEFETEFGGHTDKVLESEFLIVSPGIPGSIPVIREALKKGIQVISEIEFGYRILNKRSKIIAVTGSNGKSTTVSFLKHLLDLAGYKTLLAGNIGFPFTDYPIEKDIYDFIVLELSSFQLEKIKKFKADVAVILNITPDHLNRYDSFDHYALTKFKIMNNQKSEDKIILNLDDEKTNEIFSGSKAKVRRFSLNKKTNIFCKNNLIELENGTSIDFSLAKIKGQHNIANVMASILAIEDFVDDNSIIEKALQTFNSLENRLEVVTKKNGVTFINDSKATNTMSVISALNSFDQKLNIILGGSEKGEDFSVLVPLLKKNANSIHLIGDTTQRMRKSFSALNDEIIYEHSTFSDAVKSAYELANENEIVLLSPACASYDMFKNYEERGKTFRKIVRSIS